MKSDVENLYSVRARLYNFLFVDFFRYSAALKKFFSKRMYLTSDMKILDAGCGTGAVTRAMHKITEQNSISGVTFHSFDLTRAMLDIFQRWINKQSVLNIELKKADILKPDQLPNNWGKYDLIVSSAMLEHLKKGEILGALKNLRKLLDDEGIILVFITKQSFLMKWLVQFWWNANMYRKAEIRQVFEEANYESIKFRKFPFPYCYVNHWGYIVEARKKLPC